MTKLHPYLNFAGNAEEAFTFYRPVFGGEFSALVRFADMPMEGVEIPKEHRAVRRQVAGARAVKGTSCAPGSPSSSR